MEKSDLKTGMLVELANNAFYLVYKIENNLYLGNTNGWLDISDYTETFLYHKGSSYNIIKVYKAKFGYEGSSLQFNLICNSKFRNAWMNLVWQEPIETIEIAGQEFNKEEVENALKNLKPIK